MCTHGCTRCGSILRSKDHDIQLSISHGIVVKYKVNTKAEFRMVMQLHAVTGMVHRSCHACC